MSLQIKQIIPSQAAIYYLKDWIGDPTSSEYQEVKTRPPEELLKLSPLFFFDFTTCLGLALVEKGAKQFVTPLDFSEEDGKILPIDPDEQEYFVSADLESSDLNFAKAKIINQIKGL